MSKRKFEELTQDEIDARQQGSGPSGQIGDGEKRLQKIRRSRR